MKKVNKKKYAGGGMTPYLQTDFNSQLPDRLISPVQQYAAGNYNPGSSANVFKSSKFKNAVSGTVNTFGTIANTGMELAGNMMGPATASTVSESRTQTAMNTIGGAAKGATAGFTVGGPVGAIVGGVAGLATGVIGKKGSVAISKNPYDDQVDVKYGTGILGGRRNRNKLQARARQAQENARSNQASLAMGSMNEQAFYEDYDNDIQTMAQGGTMNSLAYVDDGELINMPNGTIAEVPEEGKPTDSNLVNLPEGTRILSDKRKVPGSKETFAQMGKRLMSKKKSNRTDKYAENAAKLNEMNDQMIYDKLFAIQEATKVNKKTKNGIQAASDGDTISSIARSALNRYPKRNYYRKYGQVRYEERPDYSSFNLSADPNKLIAGYDWDQMPTVKVQNPKFSDYSLNDNVLATTPESQKVTKTTTSKPAQAKTSAQAVVANTFQPTTRVASKPVISRRRATSTPDLVQNTLDLSGERISRVPDETAPYIASVRSTQAPVITSTPAATVTPSKVTNWSGIEGALTDIAALAPTVSNMFATPESFNAVFNPYEGQIRTTMAGRKYNIDPAKRAIRENRAVSNYNAANYNPNTGANLAYRLQSQIAEDKAISDLYAAASNAQNQYAGEYAETLNNLGQQRVQATNLATDLNARSRAAARNIQRTALSQLSQYAQNKQLMKNQKSRDMAMLDMYAPFLEAGFNAKDFASFMKKFKKG